MLSSPFAFVGLGLAFFTLFAVIGSIIRYHHKRKTEPIGFSEIFVFLNWVDTQGLRKMIDPMEEAFLRQTHSRIEFGKIQEARLDATDEYFRKIINNATALQNFGYRHLGGTDHTRRLLAHRLINFAVPVRMCARTGIYVLRVWRLLRILRFALISLSLPDLKDVVEETLSSYQELKEAALALAVYSEPGTEQELFPRL